MNKSFKKNWKKNYITDEFFSHLFNGELFHNCYYNILINNENRKIVIFSSLISCDFNERFHSNVNINFYQILIHILTILIYYMKNQII